MCAVFMYLNPLYCLRIDIAGNIRPLVDHKHRLSRRLRLVRKYRSVEPRPYNQIIIFHVVILLFRQCRSSTAFCL